MPASQKPEKQISIRLIANALGIAESVVRYHEKKNKLPRNSIEAAVAWYEDYKTSTHTHETHKKPGRPPIGPGTARDRKIELECKKLEVAIAKARGETLPREEVGAFLAKMAANLNLLASNILTKRITSTAGFTPEQLTKWGHEQHRDLCARMKTSIDDWNAKIDKEHPLAETTATDD